MRTCDVEGCGRKAIVLGMCRPHYGRQWRTGKVRPEVPIGTRQPYIRLPGRLSVGDVVEALGISDTTVRRYGDKGLLSVHVDSRGHRWFDPQDVTAFKERMAAGEIRRVWFGQYSRTRPKPEVVRPSRPAARRSVYRFDPIDTDEL